MRWVISHSQKYRFQENGYEIFIHFFPPFTLDFAQGRDLSRTNPSIHKISHNKDLAAISADFLGKPTLRFAFDQTGFSFFKNPFMESFSIQGLVGGVIIKQDGSALFFHPELPLHELLLTEPMVGFSSGLMIGYCQKPLYIHNPLDPYNALLKNIGYNFGDNLKESSHPTLIRL